MAPYRRSVTEELALPLRGKKNKLNRADLIEYFGGERLGLSSRLLDKTLAGFARVRPRWEALLEISFLSAAGKARYLEVINDRFARLYD